MATVDTTTTTTPANPPAAGLVWLASGAHAALRIGAGLLFIPHGLQKVFGLLGGAGGSGAAVPLVSLLGLAGVLEFVGGILLVVGLLTRPVAAILTLEMLVAYVKAHMPQGGLPIQNGGELALLYALVFFALTAFGSGPLSLDRRWWAGTGG
ncbi:MAG: DoxX family protein [Candidatus Latescibacterota bacterium]